MQPVSPLTPQHVEYIPENYFAPLRIGALFPGREEAPLQVDLGCGDGSFLLAMAALQPEHNFVGVERLKGRASKTSRRAARAGLCNSRVIRIESQYFLQYMLPAASASVLHVMFPDPWPKKKHNSRRLIQAPFLNVAHGALRPGGELRLTTDDLPYFEHMREVFGAHLGFREEPWEPGEGYPQTDFERLFRGQGLPIYRALLRRVELPDGYSFPPVPDIVVKKRSAVHCEGDEEIEEFEEDEGDEVPSKE